jgi:uncharacterized protein YdhG (YjbR/CyaY superfamily)
MPFSMPNKPETIDAYLSGIVDHERRAALEKLRRTLHAALPNLEECISYSMPAFRYEGKVVAGFLATAKGCSYFPFSGTTLATVSADIASYSQTKSALHFAPKKGLPATLVRKLLAARLAEIALTKKPAKRTAKRTAKTGGEAPAKRGHQAPDADRRR